MKWWDQMPWSSDDHYIYYFGQESLRRNGAVLIINKTIWNAVLGCNLKNHRMIWVCFQGKPFNIIVIQVYAPTTITDSMDVGLGELRELVMDREAWHAAIHGVTKSWTWLSDWTDWLIEGLIGLHRTSQLQLLWHYWLGHHLDHYDVDWFAL